MLSTIKRAKPKREDIFRITDEKKPSIAQFFIYLAGVGRLELTTCGFGDPFVTLSKQQLTYFNRIKVLSLV